MKKIYVLCLLSACFFPSSDAQEALDAAQKWGINGLQLQLGVDINEYASMSHAQLMGMAKNPSELTVDLSGLEEETRVHTGGGALNIGFLIGKGSPSSPIESNLYTALILHSEKEAMVSFKNQALDTSVVFCNLHSEIALELAYLWSGTWGKRWNWSIGVGSNVGTTFSNQMILMTGEYFEPGQHPSSQEVSMSEPLKFEGRKVSYARMFIPFGVHYNLTKNASLGLNFKRGIGWQRVQGDGTHFIRQNIGMALTLGLKI